MALVGPSTDPIYSVLNNFQDYSVVLSMVSLDDRYSTGWTRALGFYGPFDTETLKVSFGGDSDDLIIVNHRTLFLYDTELAFYFFSLNGELLRNYATSSNGNYLYKTHVLIGTSDNYRLLLVYFISTN